MSEILINFVFLLHKLYETEIISKLLTLNIKKMMFIDLFLKYVNK